MRLLPAGDSALLVELAGLEPTLALLDRLIAEPPEGVLDIVPGARTVLMRFDPYLTDRNALGAHLAGLDLSGAVARQGETFEIPVDYSGEDLQEVADLLGWSVAELIRRHTEACYTVAFTGFAPGFAYMTCDDPAFDVPRRKTPRLRIPAGAVALAGPLGGIYPSDSPGGWQILGITPLKMWDLSRPRPALLAPGDRVRFRDLAKGATISVETAARPASLAASLSPEPALTEASSSRPTGALRILRADRPALWQDPGRLGQAGQGVGESGPLDREAARSANLCLGNAPDAAVIEVTFGGLSLRADEAVTLAVTGAPAPLTILTALGQSHSLPFGAALALDAGDTLDIGTPARGMRSYLALRGGFAVTPVMGSAATDTLAKVGPPSLQAGDLLIAAARPARAIQTLPAPRALPCAGETVTLDILPGPRADWFTPEGLACLSQQDWLVTPDSNRVGMRLQGAQPIARKDQAELASEATVNGAIQVPHSGQPVLFLADHPLTGGYPVIACIAAHHLDLAGQIPPGARIRFNPIAPFEPQTIEAAAVL